MHSLSTARLRSAHCLVSANSTYMRRPPALHPAALTNQPRRPPPAPPWVPHCVASISPCQTTHTNIHTHTSKHVPNAWYHPNLRPTYYLTHAHPRYAATHPPPPHTHSYLRSFSFLSPFPGSRLATAASNQLLLRWGASAGRRQPLSHPASVARWGPPLPRTRSRSVEGQQREQQVPHAIDKNRVIQLPCLGALRARRHESANWIPATATGSCPMPAHTHGPSSLRCSPAAHFGSSQPPITLPHPSP